MIALATWSTCGVVALNLALTAALLRRVRVAQRLVELRGGLPDPNLPAIGRRLGGFATPLATGDGSVDDAMLRGGETLVAFVTYGCLQCEALCEQLEEAPSVLPVRVFVHLGAEVAPLQRARMVARLARVGPVAVLDAQTRAAFGFEDESGFPMLFHIDRGAIASVGHRVVELAPRVRS